MKKDNKEKTTEELLEDRSYLNSKIDIHAYPLDYNKAIMEKVKDIDEELESRDGKNFHEK